MYIASQNINDCDGTPCGGDSCESGGQCWLDESLQPHCKCPDNLRGERCEFQESCKYVKCKNNGKCSYRGQCDCPNGWGGFYCEIGKFIGFPMPIMHYIEKKLNRGFVVISLFYLKINKRTELRFNITRHL